MKSDSRFRSFKQNITEIDLPEHFTFPFFYDPHPLALIAAQELQESIETNQTWEHNFGLESYTKGQVIGKMFGVLVVEDIHGNIGYLAGFSGKIGDLNHYKGFVPPVFDMLKEGSFFNEEMPILVQYNEELAELENCTDTKDTFDEYEQLCTQRDQEIETQREQMRIAKRVRKHKRELASTALSNEEFNAFKERLTKESLVGKNQLRSLVKYWEDKITPVQVKREHIQQEIKRIKTTRKAKSIDLQRRLFEQYSFLNISGQEKSLYAIFKETVFEKPPSGAGECAAPKLLQYAFLNNYRPICMAEFWWGASPKSEIRQHQQFYPACRGKCEPILGHMLDGMSLDPNPMLLPTTPDREIEILFEDDYLLVINKPHEFLSVPGKTIQDSVYERMRAKYPSATGPLIVHRLDMATSGILLISKTKEINKHLQQQFIQRTIRKRYIALLDGELEQTDGVINLPLALDVLDRPRQMVSFEHGKPAQTRFEIIATENGKTRIHFYPITGRTHQLRVHSAHQDGLNTPIVGDDLYGTKGKRLCLHAEMIEFIHPATKRVMRVQCDPEF